MELQYFNTEEEALAAADAIFTAMLRARAAEYGHTLDDWQQSPPTPISVDELPDDSLTGDRFPLYGRRAADLVAIVEEGHTIRWAVPVEAPDSRWWIELP